MNAKVDTFLSNVDTWQKELTLLRDIILDCGLTEDYKWMHPCYTYNNKNVVLIHGFKEYCAILFPKGVLLKDTEDILVQQTENVQAARQIRFTNSTQIESLKSTLKAYIFEAIEVEKSGVKVKMKKTSDFNMPEELQQQFKENPELKKAFESLTPGRQKGYLLFFSKPKQSATRTSRIIKNTNKILNGKGLNDCVCGLSKRFPICDGSHKSLE